MVKRQLSEEDDVRGSKIKNKIQNTTMSKLRENKKESSIFKFIVERILAKHFYIKSDSIKDQINHLGKYSISASQW